MPAAVAGNQSVGVFRPPGAAFIRANRVMSLQDPIDDCPGSFNGVFASEKRPVPMHGVAQEPLIGRLYSRLLFRKEELPLLSYEFLARQFHTSGERKCRLWREPKSHVVRFTRRLHGVGK